MTEVSKAHLWHVLRTSGILPELKVSTPKPHSPNDPWPQISEGHHLVGNHITCLLPDVFLFFFNQKMSRGNA